MHPILVRREDNKYRIIAGERRYRAYKKLDKKEICCRIIGNKGLDGDKELAYSVEENLIREDFSPMEKALAFSEIRKNTLLSNAELAKHFGKSESYISEMLSLTKLNSEIQDFLLADKKIPMRKIKKIATIKEQEEQLAAFENLKEQYYPELQTENVVYEKKNTPEKEK